MMSLSFFRFLIGGLSLVTTHGAFRATSIDFKSINESPFVLDMVITFLRNGDDRLVRYDLPDEEARWRQHTACSNHLEETMSTLMQSVQRSNVTLEVQTQLQKMIKILTLCSTNNPTVRESIGRFKDGAVLAAITHVLDPETYGAPIAAAASESIWILSFHNVHNHHSFASNGAIPALIRILMSTETETSDHVESDKHKTKTGVIDNGGETEIAEEDVAFDSIFLAKMWASAALQNLAASYCKTESGHCWWEYDTRNGLHLHPESRLEIDGSTAAKEIAHNFAREGSKSAVDFIRKLICNCNATNRRAASSRPEDTWVSLARENGMVAPEMMVWSAVGLVKNLALYGETRDISFGMKDCLCNLVWSPDWLESSKASDALYRLGVDEEYCEQDKVCTSGDVSYA